MREENKTKNQVKDISPLRLLLFFVFTIAVFSGAADQVSSFTHGDPRFAVTSNSSNIKHRRLLSAPGLPLHGNTRRDTHARTHTSACLYVCMCVLFVPRRVCVCVLRTMDGLLMKYSRKSSTLPVRC